MSGYVMLVIREGFYYVTDIGDDTEGSLILAVIRTEYTTDWVANEFYQNIGTRTVSHKKAIRKFTDCATGKKSKSSKIALVFIVVMTVVGILLKEE